jgi:ATP/maltotriose-dependent transcriptional regulator MalT
MRLAAVASEASQFAGWLATATGAHDDASPLYDQALRLGMQARNNDLAATALSMRGHFAWVTGDIAGMADLSQTAADLADAKGTRTVAIQQGGRALAILGDRQAALSAIGEAEDTLASDAGPDNPDGLYFYDAEMLAMQRGLVLAYLADSPAEHAVAADAITAGIEALPAAWRNSEWVAWYRVQAATARAASGDAEQATAALLVALGIVSTTGGQKTLREIAETHRLMADRWPEHPAVAELGEALR